MSVASEREYALLQAAREYVGEVRPDADEPVECLALDQLETALHAYDDWCPRHGGYDRDQRGPGWCPYCVSEARND